MSPCRPHGECEQKACARGCWLQPWKQEALKQALRDTLRSVPPKPWAVQVPTEFPAQAPDLGHQHGPRAGFRGPSLPHAQPSRRQFPFPLSLGSFHVAPKPPDRPLSIAKDGKIRLTGGRAQPESLLMLSAQLYDLDLTFFFFDTFSTRTWVDSVQAPSVPPS